MARIIGIIVIILAIIVGYMYFFGKEDDKVNAHTIVGETKELGKSVGDFLSRQKDKYDDGEFDALINKIGISLSKLKGKTSDQTDDVKKDLKDLETKLKEIDPEKLSEENRQKLKRLLHDLDNELK